MEGYLKRSSPSTGPEAAAKRLRRSPRTVSTSSAPPPPPPPPLPTPASTSNMRNISKSVSRAATPRTSSCKAQGASRQGLQGARPSARSLKEDDDDAIVQPTSRILGNSAPTTTTTTTTTSSTSPTTPFASLLSLHPTTTAEPGTTTFSTTKQNPTISQEEDKGKRRPRVKIQEITLEEISNKTYEELLQRYVQEIQEQGTQCGGWGLDDEEEDELC